MTASPCCILRFQLIILEFKVKLKQVLSEDDLEDFKSCISNLVAENTELKVGFES
jgi:hypothetical protein